MILALLLIGAAVSGTLTEASGRPGFYQPWDHCSDCHHGAIYEEKWKQDQTAS